MKLSKKLFLGLILSLTILMTSGVSVFAAKKVTLNATFKGKTITLVTYSSQKQILDENCEKKIKVPTTFSAIKKMLGKATKTYKDSDVTVWTYKKGKSSIEFSQTRGSSYMGTQLTVKDKNISVNGVKVGMKKAAALKQLKKVFGKSAVSTADGQIQVRQGCYMPLIITLKSGKVSEISWFHS